jgi:TPR repeat protein
LVIDPGVGAVEASGATEVKPDATTVYSLTATGPTGQNSIRAVRLAVEIDPRGPTLFARAEAEQRAGHLQAALSLFRRASELGDSDAMVQLGGMLADGEGVPRNYPEALHWFNMAADRGNPVAMLQLYGMYSLGQGVSEDYARAAYWARKAADLGDSRGKFDLGEAYEQGEAIALYREAAKLGHEDAKKRYQQLIGVR